MEKLPEGYERYIKKVLESVAQSKDIIDDYLEDFYAFCEGSQNPPDEKELKFFLKWIETEILKRMRSK